MKTHNAKWLLIALILIFAAMFSTAIAEGEILKSGECGANARWEVDSEGTLTISGTGKMYDYEYEHEWDLPTTPWEYYKYHIKKVVIEDGITSIGNGTFAGISYLKSVSIPDSVTSIGEEAFLYCLDLPSIIIPNSVTSIGHAAFYACVKLTSITIPNSVTSIGGGAFAECESLTSVTLPEGLTSIEDSLFGGCESLQSISIPDGVTSIGSGAFTLCRSLTSITLPEGVTSIGSVAFKWCGGLTSFVIPKGVTSIEEGTFWGCNLTSITIPDGVTSIGEDAFYECIRLASIELPDSLTSIGFAAFADCTSLTRVVIPEGVTSIGGKAFYCCSILESIILPDSLTSIGESAFESCFDLKSVTLPEGLASISEKAFYECTSLTGIVIPDGVTSIGREAFDYCYALESVTLPDSLTSIGEFAFHYCRNVTDVYAGSLESWLGITFYNDSSNPMCYGAGQLYFNNELAVNITVPDGVTSIGNYAFYNCSSLRSVTLPKSVTSIGVYAFSDCISLAGIEVPEGVTSIGEYAFYHCRSMTDIDLPDSVTSMGVAAFWGCTSLTSIAIPDGVTSFSASLFNSCDSLTSIVIPDSVESIKSYAFSGCSKLTKVYLLGEEAPKFTFSTYFDKSKVTIYCHEFSDVDFWAAENGYTCVYVDPDAPESLSISLSAETEFYPGEALKLRVNTFPRSASKYPIAWASSDDGVVAVRNGVPTAVSAGTATLTASCGSLSDSVTVTVLPVTTPKTLVLPEDARLAIDATLTIQVETSPLAASEYSIAWESSNPEVATVENGVVHPVSVGTATITASCGVKSDSMEVTVYEEMRSFELSASELWLVSKETAQLTVENILPAGATIYTFTWKSSDTTILTVEEGAITAKVPGDAVVTVTSSNGISRQCIVHVCYPVTAIAFENGNVKMNMGETVQLMATVTTRGQSFVNKLVCFASSDEAIATVDENGLVTAIGHGSATITATAASGVAASCKITVRNPNTLVLPAQVKLVAEEAFIGNDAEEVVLPDGCREIHARAFANNGKLLYAYMPDSISSIAEDAFEGCDKVCFVCESENTAAAYAKEHKIPYIIEE